MAKKKSIFTFADKKFRSAKGIAKYAYLTKPDEKFGTPNYKITVYFDPKDPEFAAFVDTAKKFQAEYFKGLDKKVPSGLKFIKSDEETGKMKITFKTTAKQDDNGKWIPIPVYDRKVQPTNRSVWSDDIVRVGFSLAGWNSSLGTGVKVFLNSVQLIQSNHKSIGDNGGVFEEEDAVDSDGSDSTEASENPYEPDEGEDEDTELEEEDLI